MGGLGSSRPHTDYGPPVGRASGASFLGRPRAVSINGFSLDTRVTTGRNCRLCILPSVASPAGCFQHSVGALMMMRRAEIRRQGCVCPNHSNGGRYARVRI